ncbi:MAG: sulfur carrier protein ThiS [Austwickia sp.]|jgi:sulfur carrier protein|nr:MAG: sulfur carrier protein ThiS [Austwickia sp.]
MTEARDDRGDPVVVNGQPEPAAAGQSLQAFVAAAGYVLDRIAIELNGDIVPKAAYSERLLRAGDRLEIVQFMGGG